MVRSRKFGLHEKEMDMLHDWRIFMEGFSDDTFREYQYYDENKHVISFEIYYGDIKKHPRLHTSLLNWTDKCLELGNRVLFEHFQKFGIHPRPVLRIYDDDTRTYLPIESLRMRDRGRIIPTSLRVKKTKEYMGWLKIATYYCLECGTEQEIPQRLGRNRKRPYHCDVCFEEFMGQVPPPEIGDVLRFNPIFEFDAEKCKYEDIQYLEVQSIEHDGCRLDAFVRDELVGEFKEGDVLDVIVLVRLDHIAKRNFEEDTRRVLLLEILNAKKRI